MKVEIPDWLLEIARNAATQDNRITKLPIFIVEEKKEIAGFDEEYGGYPVWVDDEESEPLDSDEQERLEGKYQRGYDEPDWCRRVLCKEQWEFVTACFTEQGCKDYIAQNGHNHSELRIFAAGSARNNEWQFLLKWLYQLAEQEAAS